MDDSSLKITDFACRYALLSLCVSLRLPRLSGYDSNPAKSYEHRRTWLEFKLLETADLFAIKLWSYAVMNNHYHVVLHVRTDIAKSWSDHDVITRWHSLFNGEPMSRTELSALRKDIKCWRQRLCDISWFMRIVNESITRQANVEDQCTGRFWEGRFKRQAILDDQALLSCIAYVDLNPIRAEMAATPETSEYTSIKHRLEQLKEGQTQDTSLENSVGITEDSIGIPFKFMDYLELLDWTGRIIRSDKRGYISHNQPDILARLNLDVLSWQILTTGFEDRFQRWVGSEQIVKRACQGYK